MSSNQKITILNSRQGLYPCRLHDWIQATLKALQSQKHSQPTIVSSVGMSTWDLVTIAASDLQLKLELHIQIKDNITEKEIITSIISSYNLNPQLVTFEIIPENSSKEFQTKRDNSVTSSADTIFPISIRPHGNLEKLILMCKEKVDNRFKTIYKKRKEKIAYTLNDCNLSREIQNLSDNYLIHWTKTSKDRWYHENQFDYYTDILESDNYPRRAIDSLSNIIKTQTIFATPTHMPQNIPTVSFSSLTPVEMTEFFKWRSRYREMSFEPYGIGIKNKIANENKIQKVLYYEKNNSDKQLLHKSNIWLTQSKGMHTNWESENEYRHLGDFHLDTIDIEDIILFTRYKKEADQLQKLTGCKTISFIS